MHLSFRSNTTCAPQKSRYHRALTWWSVKNVYFFRDNLRKFAILTLLSAQLLVEAGARSLTPEEIAFLAPIFNNTVNFSQIDINNGRGLDPRSWPPIGTGSAVTLENSIYFPTSGYKPDFSTDIAAAVWLAHEIAHVWQYQNDPNYSWAKAAAEGIYSDNYNFALTPGKSFDSYRYEQQASIIMRYAQAILQKNTADIVLYGNLIRSKGLGIAPPYSCH